MVGTGIGPFRPEGPRCRLVRPVFGLRPAGHAAVDEAMMMHSPDCTYMLVINQYGPGRSEEFNKVPAVSHCEFSRLSTGRLVVGTLGRPGVRAV